MTGFGSINPLTGQLVVNFAEKGNTASFKKHLRKILKTYKGKRKIIVYVDNVRYHHAKALKPFLEAHAELEIRYLPAYLPDMNPAERVWRSVSLRLVSIVEPSNCGTCAKELLIIVTWHLSKNESLCFGDCYPVA